MRKFVKDPNTMVNQHGYQTSSGAMRSADGTMVPQGSSGNRHMADSYAKRSMFIYGVEENQFGAAAQGNNPVQTTEQMMTMLEN